MIYLLLFYEYFKIGLFSFGGGYATLPFLYHLSDIYNWYTAKQLSDMIAVSSITPGPVGVNVATYTGYNTAGIIGAILATFSVVLPSLIFVICIAKLLNKFRENKFVKAAIYSLKPAGCGLLLAVAIKLFLENVTQIWSYTLFIVLILMSIKIKKDPLVYLGLSAVIGLVFGLFKFI